MRKPCIYCGSLLHTKSVCFKKPQKPRTPIRKVSKKTAKRKRETDKEWYDNNLPNENGQWPCYLRIAPDCELWVDKHTINLEHKKSKARHPGMKFDSSNLGAACQPCNKMKGSLDDTDVL
jgi:5-methylcytosine-specific restriction endonuclease McrA